MREKASLAIPPLKKNSTSGGGKSNIKEIMRNKLRRYV